MSKELLSSDEMGSDLFNKIEKELFPTLKWCRIGGNNLGEQLLAKKWDDYSERIAAYPLKPWVITNGQNFTTPRLRKLVENEFIIDISIDAASEDRYREIRGARLSKLLSNVRKISQERAGQGKTGCRIIFSFTAFQDNVYELPRLVRLAADLGVDEVMVTHFGPTIESQRYQQLFYHQTTANQVFSRTRELAAELNIRVSLPPSYPIKKLPDEEGQNQEPGITGLDSLRKRDYGTDKKCLHPWTSVSINERGEVYPCCISTFRMGDLKKSRFEKIWNSNRYQKLRKTVNTSRPLKDCRFCPVRGGAFTSHNCENGEYFLRFIDYDVPRFVSTALHKEVKTLFFRHKFTRWLWTTLGVVYRKIRSV